jgi:C4-dicarboxylate transporter DctQ subunit
MKKVTKVAALLPRGFDRVCEGVALASGIVVFLLVLLIVCEVIARKVFSAPLGFVFEVSTYAVIAVVLLPLAFIQAQKRHVSVDLIVSRLSPRKQIILDIFACVLCFVLCAFLAWKSAEIAWRSYQMGLVSATTLRVPLFIPQAIVPIGSALVCLQFLLGILRAIRSLVGLGSVGGESGEEPGAQ